MSQQANTIRRIDAKYLATPEHRRRRWGYARAISVGYRHGQDGIIYYPPTEWGHDWQRPVGGRLTEMSRFYRAAYLAGLDDCYSARAAAELRPTVPPARLPATPLHEVIAALQAMRVAK